MFAQLIKEWGGHSDFIQSLGVRHLRGTVTPAASQALVTWADLTDVIVTRRLAPPDLVLAAHGQLLPPDLYLDKGPSPLRRQHPVVDPEKLRECLSEGATLVINNLHDMLPRVTETARDLGRKVGERVAANLYATWGNTNGFAPHWDDHDVLIVQVHGTKHWDVYGPGKPWPLDHAEDSDNHRPDTPVWSGDLTPGDVLYLPRGWWHNVEGTGNATVHLTYGFQRRTGMNYLNWLFTRAREDETFRMDLPHSEIGEHGESLTDSLISLMKSHPPEAYLADFTTQIEREIPPQLQLLDITAHTETEPTSITPSGDTTT